MVLLSAQNKRSNWWIRKKFTILHSKILLNLTYEPAWDFGTYHIVGQRRPRLVSTKLQTCQSLHYWYIQHIDIDKDSGQNLILQTWRHPHNRHLEDAFFFLSTKISCTSQYGPSRDKTCLRGFLQSDIQISLLSYRDKLEHWNFRL